MKNSFKVILGTLVIIGSLAFTTTTVVHKKDKKVLVIDVSHGGTDNGVAVDGFSEKEIVQEISNTIQALNTNKNLEIILTRSGDQTISLQERVNYINTIRPDLVLSIHINSSEETTNSGMELYVSEKSKNYKESKEIAEKLKDKFISKNPFQKAKVKNANFFILNNIETPAVTVELGFLTNFTDRTLLTNPDEQNKIAKTILELVSEL
jgi:N-acetylmuramoyl-L-alanine amidase